LILNYIWVAFFLISFVVGLVKLIFFGDMDVFPAILNGTFTSAQGAFNIALGYTGAITLWMGIMKVGEKAGAINFLSRIVGPFFSRLFPEIPKNHPATGNILLNYSANLLGLSNAATPLGLKAMQSMQELNPKKDTASNAQIMFLVLNTSGLTLIPVTIMALRMQSKAANPTDIFIPVLIATYTSALCGLLAVSIRQRINLLDKVLLSWLIGITAIIVSIIWYFTTLSPQQISEVSSLSSSIILFSIIITFITGALVKKINVFESFIEGAKSGFETVIKILPYLVAMLVGIGVFRASGAMDFLIKGFAWGFEQLGVNTDFIPAIPTALMKPLSGSGSQAMMLDTMKSYGADSFVGRLSCIIQGSADTTFYIVALYFGSVGVSKTRYAITYGLFTDFCGILAAIFVAYLFFH